MSRCSISFVPTNETEKEIMYRVATITDPDPHWNTNMYTSEQLSPSEDEGSIGIYPTITTSISSAFEAVIDSFNSGGYPSALKFTKGEATGLSDSEIDSLRTFMTISYE